MTDISSTLTLITSSIGIALSLSPFHSISPTGEPLFLATCDMDQNEFAAYGPFLPAIVAHQRKQNRLLLP